VSALERLLAAVLLLAVLTVGGWLGLERYGAARYQDGYDAAVKAGKEASDGAAVAHLAIESGLRAQLLARDTSALRKEQENAEALEAAQRRVRAGVDSLRCPTASPVQSAAPASDRPIAAGPTPDGQGAELVPDAAAEVLGDGATIAGIVRKFDRLEQRFEKCRAVSAAP
jgi:hypothetical protein